MRALHEPSPGSLKANPTERAGTAYQIVFLFLRGGLFRGGNETENLKGGVE
jgi:hypothetical protein